MRQISLWDENARLAKLSELGDALERLNKVINWEMFRPKLVKVFKKEAKGAGGHLRMTTFYCSRFWFCSGFIILVMSKRNIRSVTE